MTKFCNSAPHSLNFTLVAPHHLISSEPYYGSLNSQGRHNPCHSLRYY